MDLGRGDGVNGAEKIFGIKAVASLRRSGDYPLMRPTIGSRVSSCLGERSSVPT